MSLRGIIKNASYLSKAKSFEKLFGSGQKKKLNDIDLLKGRRTLNYILLSLLLKGQYDNLTRVIDKSDFTNLDSEFQFQKTIVSACEGHTDITPKLVPLQNFEQLYT